MTNDVRLDFKYVDNRKAAKISALSPEKNEKYEYLTGEKYNLVIKKSDRTS